MPTAQYSRRILRTRCRIGQSCRFDNNTVEFSSFGAVQLLEGRDEIPTDGATDAPVHDLDEFFIDVFAESFFVHADVPEFVHDDGEFPPVVRIPQNVVEEGRLARP